MADSLNSWIRDIEAQLSDLSPGERAQIVVELDRQLRKLPLTSYDELTRTFGSPVQVANRYKLHHGQNPFLSNSNPSPSIVNDYYKQSRSRPVGTAARRFFKFATFALLAFLILLVACVFIIPIAFFKFIAIDNFNHDFNFSFGNHMQQMQRVEGKIGNGQLVNFTFNLSNGRVTLTDDPNATEISYDCEIDSSDKIKKEQAAKLDGANASLNLLNVENADCDISVPPRVALSVNVNNGKIDLNEMNQQVEANLSNGEIQFQPAEGVHFELQPKVQVGSVDGLEAFNSAQKKQKGPPFTAALSVGNGRINLE